MIVHRKQTILVLAVLVVLLVAMSFFMGSALMDDWKKTVKAREKLGQQNEIAGGLIQKQADWQERLDALRGRLPRFAPGQPVTAELLKTIKKTADEHQISISRMEPDEEKQVGDLSEVAIECNWDGELDSIVRFLYAVQVQGAILDIRQLTISPAQGVANRLKGSFTVYCAFSREEPVEEAPAAATAGGEAAAAPSAGTEAGNEEAP